MKLSSLSIRDVRNLRDVTLDNLGSVNLFCGSNGAGKSSILEAIHMLALARSFRSAQLKPVIAYDADNCLVFGRISLPDLLERGDVEQAVGIQRFKGGKSIIKIDGELQKSVIALAERLPIQLINASSYLLLDSGPKLRRQFLDWGVFHVEPKFMAAWKKAQRCIKQRNACLRSGATQQKNVSVDIGYWNKEMVGASEFLDRSRQSYFSAFEPCFGRILGQLSSLEGVKVRYQRGWAAEKSLVDVLKANYQRDLVRGITQSGPHRADMRVTVNGIDAAQVLSRGQLKLVVCAMRLAQMELFQQQTNRSCLLLVDDLPAEIDIEHQRRLCSLIDDLDAQVFITSIESSDILEFSWEKKGAPNVFHVKQGAVLEGA